MLIDAHPRRRGAEEKPEQDRCRTADPLAFIAKVKSDVKRSDSHELVAMMQAVVGDRGALRKVIEHSVALTRKRYRSA